MQQRCGSSRYAGLVMAVLLVVAGGAHAAGGHFGVSARVLPRPVVEAALAGLPAPSGAMPMVRLPHGESFVYAGHAATAADFYRTALPSRGYRLVHASGDGLLQAWRGDDATVHLTLAEAPGSSPLTRIVVEVGAE